MSMKSLDSKILAPGYSIILVGSIVENGILRTNSFLVGSLIGLAWFIAGVFVLMRASKDLKKGEQISLVQSGLFSVTRNPALVAHFFAIMPGLCLLLNTNIGIVGIICAVVLFYRHIGAEERELEERFGEVYQAYRERVPRLLPLPTAGMS